MKEYKGYLIGWGIVTVIACITNVNINLFYEIEPFMSVLLGLFIGWSFALTGVLLGDRFIK